MRPGEASTIRARTLWGSWQARQDMDHKSM